MTTLGELVAADRQKKGLTQTQLAEVLAKLGRQSRFKKAEFGTEANAVRAWLAKLESGKLRRDVGDKVRELLSAALEPDDPSGYRSLPVYATITYVHQPDRPGTFSFQELWIFTREPLECRQPGYARQIVARLISEPNPIVYFVPEGGIASELCAAIRTAAQADPLHQKTIRENLHVEETTSTALALVPHFILRFNPTGTDSELKYDGFAEQAPADSQQDRAWSPLPKQHLDRVIRVLEQAQLLRPDLRYQPAAGGTVRRGAGIEFKTFNKDNL